MVTMGIIKICVWSFLVILKISLKDNWLLKMYYAFYKYVKIRYMTLCNNTKDDSRNGCILCEGETFIRSNIKDILSWTLLL